MSKQTAAAFITPRRFFRALQVFALHAVGCAIRNAKYPR